MRAFYCLTLSTFCICLLSAAHAQTAAPITAQPGGRTPAHSVIVETIADRPSAHYAFEQHTMDSADGKRHYRIEISIPKAATPSAGFPVLYMLDGNAAMDTLTDKDLAQLSQGNPPPVLVAIGYDVDTRNDVVSRAYDYTPPISGNGQPARAPVVRGRLGGGADIFLELIQTKIKPLVGARARINPSEEYLWGHSYGGLFALHTLFTQPDAFARYIVGDPSAWWNDGALVREWEAFDSKRAMGKQVAIFVGTKPREAARPVPGSGATQASGSVPAQASGSIALPARTAPSVIDQRTTINEIAEGLARAGVQVTYDTFPESGHGDMVRVSLERALQIATQR